MNSLENLAELLEAKNDSVFRIGAYRRAAQRRASWPEDIETVLVMRRQVRRRLGEGDVPREPR